MVIETTTGEVTVARCADPKCGSTYISGKTRQSQIFDAWRAKHDAHEDGGVDVPR